MPKFGVVSEDELHKVHETKKKVYPKYLNYAKCNEWLIDIINALPKEYMKALVSTASRKNVVDILSEFSMDNIFDFMVTQEDAVRLKPDPEAYLVAMKRAGVNPENTVIYEDSDLGIEAAKKSGASVFRVIRF